MELMTDELKENFPALTAQDNMGDAAIVHAKFFCPWNSWTWYATEYDPKEESFFGLVKGLDTELGYFSLADLESVTGPGGLKIERDLYFGTPTLGEVKSKMED